MHFGVSVAGCTAARSHSVTMLKKKFYAEQSNTDKRRLDRESCVSDYVASVGESKDSQL